MPKPSAAALLVFATCTLAIGCGPGGIANDGGEFGGSGTADDEPGDPTGMSEPGNPSTSSSPGTDSSDGPIDTDTDTETETGANDWTDPDTSDTSDTDDPEPIDADCSRVWTVLDSKESHGHIGATPIGPGPSGGFVSVNPVLASADGVNVDAWIRSWSPGGEVLWDQQVSWGDQRDDPLSIVSDEVGDVFMGGRINANTFEDAMISKLDGETGELIWIFLRGEAGGYASIGYNGAAVFAAGMIGDFGAQGLELIALEPDTGEVIWSAELEIGDVTSARGMVLADGKLDVLGLRGQSIEILRVSPPSGAIETFKDVDTHSGTLVPYDLERLGDDLLAAVYTIGPNSMVKLIDRASGMTVDQLELGPDDFPGATAIVASEVVELPGGQGLGIAGTLGNTDSRETFVLRVDPQLETVCSGRLSKADLGVSRSPDLRGLVVGEDGALFTGSFVDNSVRLGAFARWE